MFTMSKKQAENNSQQNRIIKTLILNRKNGKEDWGFTMTGGWEQGQWIGKNLKMCTFKMAIRVVKSRGGIQNYISTVHQIKSNTTQLKIKIC